MSVDVAATVVIERPIGEVATYAGDPSNAPEWCERISSAEWQTDPPVRLGSRIRFTTRFLGRTLDDVYEITEWTPGEQVAMRAVEGPFPMTTVYTWRPVGDRVTHMTLRNHGELNGITRLLSPVVARLMRRAMRGDLDQLRELLERRRDSAS